MNAAVAPSAMVLSGLARSLVQHQLLKVDQAVALQKQADAAHTKFIDELIASSTISPVKLAGVAGLSCGAAGAAPWLWLPLAWVAMDKVARDRAAMVRARGILAKLARHGRFAVR